MRIYLLIAVLSLTSCAGMESKNTLVPTQAPVPAAVAIGSDAPPAINTPTSEALVLLPLSEKLNECAEIDEENELVIQKWNAILKLSGTRFLKELNQFIQQHGVFEEFTQEGRYFSLLNEGACGNSYITFSQVTVSNGEPVYELNDQGQVLRKWTVPLGSGAGVVSVLGDRLIIQSPLQSICVGEGADGTGRPLGDIEKWVHFSIAPDGKFRVTEAVEGQDLPSGAPCKREGEKTAMSFCRQVKDKDKKKNRRIQYVGECT